MANVSGKRDRESMTGGAADRQPVSARRSRQIAAVIVTAAKPEQDTHLGQHADQVAAVHEQLRERVVGPRVGRDVRDRARGARGRSRAAPSSRRGPRGRAPAAAPPGRPAARVEQARRAAPPAPVLTSEKARTTAAVPEWVAPVDAEQQQRPEDDDQPPGAARSASRPRSCPSTSVRGEVGVERIAARDPEPARLDQPGRAVERVQEDEQQQLGARAGAEPPGRARVGTAVRARSADTRQGRPWRLRRRARASADEKRFVRAVCSSTWAAARCRPCWRQPTRSSPSPAGDRVGAAK